MFYIKVNNKAPDIDIGQGEECMEMNYKKKIHK